MKNSVFASIQSWSLAGQVHTDTVELTDLLSQDTDTHLVLDTVMYAPALAANVHVSPSAAASRARTCVRWQRNEMQH